MDQVTMDKLIEMIKGDLIGVSVSKKVDSVFTSINFRYDKEKDIVSYETSVYDSKTKENKATNGVITNADQIANLFDKMGLEAAAIEVVQNRIARETKFLRAKQSMIDKLKNMDLLPLENEIMMEVIEKVTCLPEIVGMGNRVTLSSTPDAYEHVRLADHTRWGDSGDKLHLQLVQTMEDSTGTKHRNYPDLTFEELVGRILDSDLVKSRVAESKKV